VSTYSPVIVEHILGKELAKLEPKLLTKLCCAPDSETNETSIANYVSHKLVGVAEADRRRMQIMRYGAHFVQDIVSLHFAGFSDVSATSELLGWLKEPDSSKRRAAIRGLASLKAPSASEHIRLVYDSLSRGLKDDATEALCKLANPESIPSLLHILESNPRVTEKVVDVLVSLGDHRAVPVLVHCFDREGNLGEMLRLATAIASFRMPETLPRLRLAVAMAEAAGNEDIEITERLRVAIRELEKEENG
jgi:hypothetical protein